MNEDGTITGDPWVQSFEEFELPIFPREEPCSRNCFWHKKNRVHPLSKWTNEKEQIIGQLGPFYLRIARGACLLARTQVFGKPCYEVGRAKLNISNL